MIGDFVRQCAEIDSSVRSGEALAEEEVRKEFKEYLDSWYEALSQYNIISHSDFSG